MVLESPLIEAPDLEILIRLELRETRSLLTYLLKAREPELKLNFKEFGPVQLEVEPRQHFEATFKEIADLPLCDDEARHQARLRLEAKGAALARALLPEELCRLLRDLTGRVTSLEIQSEEAWIPWELLRLPGEEQGRQVGGPFLCEAFALTRWQPGVEQRLDLPLRNMAVIAPKASGLGAAAGEADFLESLDATPHRVRRLEARYHTLLEEMGRGEFDGWHFIGHGTTQAVDPDLWPILLEDGDKLRPEDLSGEAANLGRAQPLVFLNGCHTARGAPSLTHVGGWATQFLRAGAGAFIGASWATRDESAEIFAEAFYRQFLQGATLGEAVRQARLYVREHFPGDPTWLAFVAYGHPLAQRRIPRSASGTASTPSTLPAYAAPSSLVSYRPTFLRKPRSAMKKPRPVIIASLIGALATLLAGLLMSPLSPRVFTPSGNEALIRVVDTRREPIQGAEVILFAKGGPFKGVTGSHGATRLDVTSSESQRGRLVVQASGFKIHEELFQRLPEDYLDVQLRRGEADAGKVLFRIVDAASGQGVAMAEVLLIQGAEPFRKTSDSDGMVDFDVDFENGEAAVRITVESLGHAFENLRLTLRPETSQDVVLNHHNQSLDVSPFGSR